VATLTYEGFGAAYSRGLKSPALDHRRVLSPEKRGRIHCGGGAGGGPTPPQPKRNPKEKPSSYRTEWNKTGKLKLKRTSLISSRKLGGGVMLMRSKGGRATEDPEWSQALPVIPSRGHIKKEER